MAYAYFDSKYAPVGFLIVPDNGDPYGEESELIHFEFHWGNK